MSLLLVGVDGGGTRTRAVATDADLEPRGRGASGPTNAATTPIPRVVEAITEAVEDAVHAAGAPHGTIPRVACGLAGAEASGLRGRLISALEARYGTGHVLVTSDARAALAGAIPGPLNVPGVVVISGTGSVAFGRNGDGLEERAGGWGPMIGDEGSGFEIARRGLAAVLRELDGRGPRTLMRETLVSAEGTRTPIDVLRRLYATGGGAADVAAYFPLVLDAARIGDTVALKILKEAGEVLAVTAATVIRKLGLAGEPVPVATVGGVFSAGDLVLGPLRERLRAEAPRAELIAAARPAEIGVLRLALEVEGWL